MSSGAEHSQPQGKTYSYKVSTREKYDGRVGKFSLQIFVKMGVEGSLGKVLAKSGNQGWAGWRKHSTAEAHILRYEKEMGKSLKFPFTKEDTLNYVGFLLKRELKVDTISGYLSYLVAQP